MRKAKIATRLILCAALAMSVLRVSAAPVQPQKPSLQSAMQEYESSRWTVAFHQFSQLAYAGDADAARITVLMSRHGQSLYKQTFAVLSDHLQTWINLASAKLASEASARLG